MKSTITKTKMKNIKAIQKYKKQNYEIMKTYIKKY